MLEQVAIEAVSCKHEMCVCVCEYHAGDGRSSKPSWRGLAADMMKWADIWTCGRYEHNSWYVSTWMIDQAAYFFVWVLHT